MALTQAQIAAQIVAQLRALDPSASAEIGTPERKIIDTIAEAIAENQIDLNLTSGALDLSSKYGTDLDQFLGLLGFGRQQGAFATGFATFGRATGSSYDITIPRGTQISTVGDPLPISFQTTSPVVLSAGDTSVDAPIQALLPGISGNVAQGSLVRFTNLGAPPTGITTVTNLLPTGNGANPESDAELKVRFKNTVFRNMAGTEDQFLALAVATQFSTKANVIGPISRFQEYVQVPEVDDASLATPIITFTANVTNGSATITNVVVTVGARPDSDAWVYSTPGALASGTRIQTIAGTTYTLTNPWTGSTTSHVTFTASDDGPGNGQPNQFTTVPSINPFAKYIYTTIPYYVSNGPQSTATIFYRQDTDFTLNPTPLDAGDTYRDFKKGFIADPATTPDRPNVTFNNIYTGEDAAVQLLRPTDVVLLEYAYVSAKSRNDPTRGVTNCVEVIVNGENPTKADAIIPPPSGTRFYFNNNPNDPFYYKNYQRLGRTYTNPTQGHLFQALFWQPVISLPTQIIIGDVTYLRGQHYYTIEDISDIGGTIRSRNGIEWDPTAKGKLSGDSSGGPYTGPTILATGQSSITITGYQYDKNVVDLQAALDGVKQVTTDALAHRAHQRYFKFDLTVVLSPGATPATVYSSIQSSISTFLSNQYFGAVIQLSEVLANVASVFGVQNVRWTNDVPNPNNDDTGSLGRVIECDIEGTPVPSGSPAVYNSDFYMEDNELAVLPNAAAAGDTLAGLIVHVRAPNNFSIV